MEKSRQTDFARRIAAANRTGLLVITYDIILEEFRGAEAHYEKGELNGYRHDLRQIQKYLSQLMGTLEFSYSISHNLLALYEYVQRLVVKCDITGNPEGIENAKAVISGLRDAYGRIAPLDSSEPLMEHTQSVYAGLTYKRGGVSEYSIDPDGAGRGFLA